MSEALRHELVGLLEVEVSVFYVEKDQLALTHYCDFGNRPHMVARPSPEGNAADFEKHEVKHNLNVKHKSFSMLG